MRDNDYIKVSIDLELVVEKIYDIRIPKFITVKELLKILNEAYNLRIGLVNPIIRDEQSGLVYTSFQELNRVKNGAMLILESL